MTCLAIRLNPKLLSTTNKTSVNTPIFLLHDAPVLTVHSLSAQPSILHLLILLLEQSLPTPSHPPPQPKCYLLRQAFSGLQIRVCYYTTSSHDTVNFSFIVLTTTKIIQFVCYSTPASVKRVCHFGHSLSTVLNSMPNIYKDPINTWSNGF